MRIAVLNDIHGNLPALEAVLDEVTRADVSRIVVGGDIFPGPAPHLVLRRLRGLDLPVEFIYGNGEVAVIEHLEGKLPAKLPASYRPLVEWNADQLDQRERDAIRGWPMTTRVDVPAIGRVLFCHATPRNENEIFTQLTAEERLVPVFADTGAPMVVCGHTHMPFDRRVGAIRVINAGSVGMPFGSAGADWLIVGPDVEFRHTTYDLDAATDRIRRSGYPGADEFVSKYLLHPPSAAEMLKLYQAHELTP